jgi:hypothetical protein
MPSSPRVEGPKNICYVDLKLEGEGYALNA